MEEVISHLFPEGDTDVETSCKGSFSAAGASPVDAFTRFLGACPQNHGSLNVLLVYVDVEHLITDVARLVSHHSQLCTLHRVKPVIYTEEKTRSTTETHLDVPALCGPEGVKLNVSGPKYLMVPQDLSEWRVTVLCVTNAEFLDAKVKSVKGKRSCRLYIIFHPEKGAPLGPAPPFDVVIYNDGQIAPDRRLMEQTVTARAWVCLDTSAQRIANAHAMPRAGPSSVENVAPHSATIGLPSRKRERDPEAAVKPPRVRTEEERQRARERQLLNASRVEEAIQKGKDARRFFDYQNHPNATSIIFQLWAALCDSADPSDESVRLRIADVDNGNPSHDSDRRKFLERIRNVETQQHFFEHLFRVEMQYDAVPIVLGLGGSPADAANKQLTAYKLALRRWERHMEDPFINAIVQSGNLLGGAQCRRFDPRAEEYVAQLNRILLAPGTKRKFPAGVSASVDSGKCGSHV